MASTTIKYFAHAHLPPKLQAVSQPVGLLAELLEKQLPDGPEKSAGMRKLLEAKDCFVRVALDMPEPLASTLAQKNVLDQKMDCDQDISRLDTFIRENAAFPALPADEQARLRRQLDVMHELSAILGERIASF
ncbi:MULTISPECIES: crAss001_48 related protein [unclassified Delftia]|uniref:crAss001_48 related protein n=1 Tax=unclassified Delftia TaxID=2613839 RepID=UPI001902B7C8|nr:MULTISPECIES: hypothetical protein [unclassified Delftia]